MLLAIDVRNTDTALGLYRGKELVEHVRFESVVGRSADEYLVLVHGLFTLRGIVEYLGIPDPSPSGRG